MLQYQETPALVRLARLTRCSWPDLPEAHRLIAQQEGRLNPLSMQVTTRPITINRLTYARLRENYPQGGLHVLVFLVDLSPRRAGSYR